MTERSKEPKSVDLIGLADKNVNFNLKTAETPDGEAKGEAKGDILLIPWGKAKGGKLKGTFCLFLGGS